MVLDIVTLSLYQNSKNTTVNLLRVMTLEQLQLVLYCPKYLNIVLLNDIRVFWLAQIISLVFKKVLAAVLLSERFEA